MYLKICISLGAFSLFIAFTSFWISTPFTNFRAQFQQQVSGVGTFYREPEYPSTPNQLRNRENWDITSNGSLIYEFQVIRSSIKKNDSDNQYHQTGGNFPPRQNSTPQCNQKLEADSDDWTLVVCIWKKDNDVNKVDEGTNTSAFYKGYIATIIGITCRNFTANSTSVDYTLKFEICKQRAGDHGQCCPYKVVDEGGTIVFDIQATYGNVNHDNIQDILAQNLMVMNGTDDFNCRRIEKENLVENHLNLKIDRNRGTERNISNMLGLTSISIITSFPSNATTSSGNGKNEQIDDKGNVIECSFNADIFHDSGKSCKRQKKRKTKGTKQQKSYFTILIVCSIVIGLIIAAAPWFIPEVRNYTLVRDSLKFFASSYDTFESILLIMYLLAWLMLYVLPTCLYRNFPMVAHVFDYIEAWKLYLFRGRMIGNRRPTHKTKRPKPAHEDQRVAGARNGIATTQRPSTTLKNRDQLASNSTDHRGKSSAITLRPSKTSAELDHTQHHSLGFLQHHSSNNSTEESRQSNMAGKTCDLSSDITAEAKQPNTVAEFSHPPAQPTEEGKQTHTVNEFSHPTIQSAGKDRPSSPVVDTSDATTDHPSCSLTTPPHQVSTTEGPQPSVNNPTESSMPSYVNLDASRESHCKPKPSTLSTFLDGTYNIPTTSTQITNDSTDCFVEDDPNNSRNEDEDKMKQPGKVGSLDSEYPNIRKKGNIDQKNDKTRGNDSDDDDDDDREGAIVSATAQPTVTNQDRQIAHGMTENENKMNSSSDVQIADNNNDEESHGQASDTSLNDVNNREPAPTTATNQSVSRDIESSRIIGCTVNYVNYFTNLIFTNPIAENDQTWRSDVFDDQSNERPPVSDLANSDLTAISNATSEHEPAELRYDATTHRSNSKNDDNQDVIQSLSTPNIHEIQVFLPLSYTRSLDEISDYELISEKEISVILHDPSPALRSHRNYQRLRHRLLSLPAGRRTSIEHFYFGPVRQDNTELRQDGTPVFSLAGRVYPLPPRQSIARSVTEHGATRQTRGGSSDRSSQDVSENRDEEAVGLFGSAALPLNDVVEGAAALPVNIETEGAAAAASTSGNDGEELNRSLLEQRYSRRQPELNNSARPSIAQNHDDHRIPVERHAVSMPIRGLNTNSNHVNSFTQNELTNTETDNRSFSSWFRQRVIESDVVRVISHGSLAICQLVQAEHGADTFRIINNFLDNQNPNSDT